MSAQPVKVTYSDYRHNAALVIAENATGQDCTLTFSNVRLVGLDITAAEGSFAGLDGPTATIDGIHTTFGDITIPNLIMKDCTTRASTVWMKGETALDSGVFENCAFRGESEGYSQPYTSHIGLVSNGNTSLTVRDCDFDWYSDRCLAVSNTKTISIDRCTFRDATKVGAEIYGSFESVRIVNSEFSGNGKTDVPGWLRGGLHLEVYNESSKITIQNCSFSNNYTDRNGAGGGATVDLHTEDDSLELVISDCSFNNNHTDYHGGGLAVKGTLNPSSIVHIVNTEFTQNHAESRGGGLHMTVSGAERNVMSCTFSENSAELGGGAYLSSGRETLLSHCEFTSNTADHGGAVYGTLTLTATVCTLQNNEAAGDGGAFYLKGNSLSAVQMENMVMKDNTADRGAAIFSGKMITCTGGEISGGAASEGAGIYLSEGAGAFTMQAMRIFGNTAGYAGGGIMMEQNVLVSIGSGGTVTGNSARYGGGVYAHLRGDVTLDGGTVTGNTSRFGGDIWPAS